MRLAIRAKVIVCLNHPAQGHCLYRLRFPPGNFTRPEPKNMFVVRFTLRVLRTCWSLLKRGLNGTYVAGARFISHCYVDERHSQQQAQRAIRDDAADLSGTFSDRTARQGTDRHMGETAVALEAPPDEILVVRFASSSASLFTSECGTFTSRLTREFVEVTRQILRKRLGTIDSSEMRVYPRQEYQR